jgi:hypothetical protein
VLVLVFIIETAVNDSSSTPFHDSLSNLQPTARGKGACVVCLEGEDNVGGGSFTTSRAQRISASYFCLLSRESLFSVSFPR